MRGKNRIIKILLVAIYFYFYLGNLDVIWIMFFFWTYSKAKNCFVRIINIYSDIKNGLNREFLVIVQCFTKIPIHKEHLKRTHNFKGKPKCSTRGKNPWIHKMVLETKEKTGQKWKLMQFAAPQGGKNFFLLVLSDSIYMSGNKMVTAKKKRKVFNYASVVQEGAFTLYIGPDNMMKKRKSIWWHDVS